MEEEEEEEEEIQHPTSISLQLLPDDIIIEILLKLTLKPLFRFNTVSKRMNSILFHPKFAADYLSHHPESSPALLPAFLYRFTDSSHIPHLSSNLKPLPDLIDSSTKSHPHTSINLSSVSLSDSTTHQILASSKGLILSILLPFLDMKNLRWNLILSVSNPLTKQSVHLPTSTLLTSPALVIGFVAKGGPFISSYRVVLIQQFACDHDPDEYVETSVETFSSDTGVWTASTLICPGEVLNKRAEQCFAHKGVLHWLGWKTRAVITYDPYNSPERLGRIQLPKSESFSDRTCLIYSGEEEVLKCCEIGDDKMCVWRLVESEWFVQGKFPVFRVLADSLYNLDVRKLVALNPWNREIVCRPYVVNDKVMVVETRTRRWESVSVLVDTPPKGPMPFDFCGDSRKDQLIPIELCPWSSPVYGQPSNDY